MDALCWKCGVPLQNLSLPLTRWAECPHCQAELHICRSCVFFDPKVAKQCREPIAEEVMDKQRANFCDYFQLRPDAYQPKDLQAAQLARAELEALFGGANDAASQASAAASEAEDARAALESLFKTRRKAH